VPEQAFNWQPVLTRRITTAAIIFGIWTTAIEARLIFLQVVSHDALSARAERQHMRTISVPAKRGEIQDRRGRLLAYSVDTDTIYAVPNEIKDPARTSAALCGALDGCTTKDQVALRDRLKSQRHFAFVKRRVAPAEARAVATLNLEGIGFMRESRRFYPNIDLAANLVGYVGVDNVGLGGLEAAYDKVIRGNDGAVLVQTDARRHAFSRLERIPTSGGSLELTIDEQIQYIAERELRAGVEENRASAGTAVVMDRRTGEILAMASWPTFNPNVYGATGEEARRNRAVQDLYEPGSTFKMVTAAAAIEENVMPVNSWIDTNPGYIRLGSGPPVDEYGGKNHGVLSFTDVIVKSSNVGAIKIGLEIGSERMDMYVRRFGFGRPVSPDFPGENPGIVWEASKLNDRALGSVSMGYQIGVTPLQMTAAMNAVANDGVWIEPRVVRSSQRDGVRTRVEPHVTRRVIKSETAQTLRPILEAVVEDGTGKAARIPGFSVAGKTGTADKVVNGRYSRTQQNVSFVGFVPSRDPAITVLVMIDSPSAGLDSGGRVAAPIFKRIAEATLRYLGVPPNLNPAPPVLVARHDAFQVAPASVPILAPTIVTLPGDDSNASLVPDFRGLSARDALRALARVGLTARLHGVGIVVHQTPAPGSPLERGVTCTLTLEREPPRLPPTGAPQ
jgi:cell division protein FtsI/penicillin-binding protein 2